MKIPFVDLQSQYLSIKPEIDHAVNAVIQETAFIGGKYVRQFEDDFASIYGVSNVISCANGTDSLYIIMKQLGIGAGDEVITVANSWISSSETISQTGARPVFVDIHPDFYSMDESKLEEAITSKTKAVIVVHLHGQMCDLQAIKEICDRRKIYLIEDCAQSHFSSFKGVRAGLTGIAASFSFYPGKNLGAYGDAGCIITNDNSLAQQFRMYANHGALKKHQHEIEGINSRMDGIQAAILSAKLPFIESWTSRRIQNAQLYDQYLCEVPQIVLPRVRKDSVHSFHLYVIRTDQRDELMIHLKNNGIETAIHYPTALPNLKCYQYLEYQSDRFPIATAYQSKILSLPMYPELTESMIAFIAEQIKQFFQKF